MRAPKPYRKTRSMKLTGFMISGIVIELDNSSAIKGDRSISRRIGFL